MPDRYDSVDICVLCQYVCSKVIAIDSRHHNCLMPSLCDLGSLHVTQYLTVEPGQKKLTPISLIHRSRFLTSDQLWPGSKKIDPCRYLPLADERSSLRPLQTSSSQKRRSRGRSARRSPSTTPCGYNHERGGVRKQRDTPLPRPHRAERSVLLRLQIDMPLLHGTIRPLGSGRKKRRQAGQRVT